MATRNSSSRRRIATILATAGLLAALPANARQASGGSGGDDVRWKHQPAAVVSSRVAPGGAPTFVWAARNAAYAPSIARTPSARAHWFVASHAGILGLPAAALATAQVSSIHELGKGGTIVMFRQEVEGVPVFRTELKVLLDSAGRLVAFGGNLNPDASPGTIARSPGWKLAATDALAAALADQTGQPLVGSDFVESARSSKQLGRFGLADHRAGAAQTIYLSDDATARRVLFPLAHGLVPAYQVEFFVGAKGAADTYAGRVVVGAADGRVLYRQDLTQSDAFQYRVWADPADKRPLDGPQQDFSPHPTGVPDGSKPAFIAPNLISMESFNHAPAGVDPWLAAGATESNGNNVDAYTDDNAPDGFSTGDLRATVTSASVFGRIYDVLLGPLVNATQEQASITQLFYETNWLHDWWYDSGFDEASHNAQALNFGRGGVEGDALQAQAQDQARTIGMVTAARNNANMSTPSDGASPRMQMYLWTGPQRFDDVSVAPLGLTPEHNNSEFGPSDFDITATAVLASDGTAPLGDACEAITTNLTGKIALIDRGTCTFASKTQRAQAAGAVAVVIINNNTMAPPFMPNESPPLTVNIPAISVTQADGATIRNAAAAGAVTVHIRRAQDVERDGSLDGGIVAHEWGHYLHHRLTHCDTTQQCGAMSEGWADFTALHMQVHEGDALDGVYNVGAYATAAMGDYAYFGIRRYPYSTNLAKNPLTFHHISDGIALPAASAVPNNDNGIGNSESHNAGEIWATMMFEAYMALVAESRGPTPKYTFEQARRAMSNYVVAGMKLTPTDATYLEQRDAILAAALAADEQDFVVLAQAFARRGAGTGAIGPVRDSTTLVGVTESFVVKSDQSFGAASVAEDADSCDNDGTLDSGELGTLHVRVISSGVNPLEGSTLEVSSATPGVSFPEGTSFPVATLAAFHSADFDIKVKLDAPFVGPGNLVLDYKLTNPSAASTTVTGSLKVRADYDNQPAASATDDVESDVVLWQVNSLSGSLPAETWSRGFSGAENHAWHGVDQGALGDIALESPELKVSASEPFKVVFKHHYSFEADTTTNWDGGVVEISVDGGPFLDVTLSPSMPAPGYNGTLGNTSMNPLSDRLAFVQRNTGYPADDTVSLSFGSDYAGKTVKLRFRIGSDQNTGDEGWFIDDIAFSGITNKPFAVVVPNSGVCAHGPHADAGDDQTVASAAAVTLDGSGSSDADGLPLTYAWTQTAGTTVSLTGADTATPTFTAPTVTEITMLEFQLSVSDGPAADTDTVVVLVQPEATPPPPNPGDGDGGGCGCVVGGRGSSRGGPGAALGTLLAGLAFVMLRRRRK